MNLFLEIKVDGCFIVFQNETHTCYINPERIVRFSCDNRTQPITTAIILDEYPEGDVFWVTASIKHVSTHIELAIRNLKQL